MTDAQTLDFLMKGGWFALEQAGRLVNDADILFEAGSHSSAAGLALLSREELPKSRELFGLWIRASRGEPITREGAVAQIESMDHFEKQRRGASGFSIPIDERALSVLRAGRTAAPAQFDEILERLRLTMERRVKRAPSDRTDQREQAFYVDASDQRDTWNRPMDMPREEVAHILEEANNDYWQQHERPGIPAVAADLARLDAALAQWDGKPQLPPAQFRKR